MYRGNNLVDDEATMVARAQRDPEAFGVLYDRYVDHIFRYLMSRTGNIQLAEDLTAETFLAALKGLWRYRWIGKPFSAWLYRIAVAQVGNFYRNQRVKTVALELAEELPELHATALPADDHPTLRHALAQLPPAQAEAIRLRYFADLPMADIAYAMGIPQNTVKSHLHRGLSQLRQRLQNSSHESFQSGQSRRAFAPNPTADGS